MRWPKKAKTFLMVLLVSSVVGSCGSIPEVKPYLISPKNNVCGEYYQSSKDPVEYKFKKWHPIEDCEGFFALSPEDVAALREYYKNNK